MIEEARSQSPRKVGARQAPKHLIVQFEMFAKYPINRWEQSLRWQNLDIGIEELHMKVENSQVFRQPGFCRGRCREPTNTFAKLPINSAHLFMRRPPIQDKDILDGGFQVFRNSV